MADWLSIAVSIPAGCYLAGSIPFGLLFARLLGRVDVRQKGSGNIGATNVARVAGPVAGILTLILDAAKGSGAVLLAEHLSGGNAEWMMVGGLFALIGHCFPIWLKFRGGKGVATAAGLYLVLCPAALLGALLLFILFVAFWRYVSLGSIAAAAAMPLLLYFLWAPQATTHHAPPLLVDFGALSSALLIVYKHDTNLQRLVEGTEPKLTFGDKKDLE